MQYKALFLDIDDTLIGSDKTVSRANKEAIKSARDAGAFVTLATGRSYMGARAIWHELDLMQPIIVYGGASIVDTSNGETLFCASIEPDLINEALEATREWGLHGQIYKDDAVISEEATEFARRYTEILNLELILDPKIRKKTWRDMPKILVYSPPEIEQEMLLRYRERFTGKLEIASSKPGYIELNRYGTNKGTTMLELAKMLHIPREETVAIGDNTLDLDMIKMAGLGLCVENGQQIVKDASDAIIPACDMDGVKYAIDKYFLNR